MNKTRQFEKKAFNAKAIHQQFPILSQSCHGKPLVYLDTGATSQKPLSVINTVKDYYEKDNANVHRGVYELSERASKKYENVRDAVQNFINARDRAEIVFTKSATEAINLVATSFGQLQVKAGDEIVLTIMEHHSNIVPWQLLCERSGAKLRVVPVKSDDTLDLKAYQELLTNKTKLVAVTHVSNVLGTINPIKEMIELAHKKNIPVLIDGAQAAPRMKVDVQALDCDFYVFSSHKMYGPTGVGVLYAKRKWLEKMPPYQGGGDMISTVSFDKTRYNELPFKFEAGTPNIAGVIGLGAAIDFIDDVGIETIYQHEKELTQYATEVLSKVPGLKIYGNAPGKVGVISFTLEGVHPHDVGTIVDNEGVAIRAGHHCAMPLITHFGVAAMIRASFGIYNQAQDIDALVNALNKVKEIFGAE